MDVDPARIGLWGGSYGGYLTALGLAWVSSGTKVTVSADGTVHHYPWFPWWLGVVITVALLAVVIRSLRSTAARRVERPAALLERRRAFAGPDERVERALLSNTFAQEQRESPRRIEHPLVDALHEPRAPPPAAEAPGGGPRWNAPAIGAPAHGADRRVGVREREVSAPRGTFGEQREKTIVIRHRRGRR